MTSRPTNNTHDSSQRNTSVDIAKGILITLVVAGHLLQGSTSDVSTRGFIYFFHMPLFILLSGYLSYASLHRDSPAISARKQFRRMGRPYLLALTLYTGISIARSDGSFSIHTAVDATLYPFYHLWYIPAVVIYFFATKALIRLGARPTFILAISAALSTGIGEFSARDSGADFLYYLGDKRYYYYWFFFALGMTIRNATLSKRWIVPCALIAAGGAATALNVKAADPKELWILFLMTNVMAALSLVAILQSFPSASLPILQATGQASLPIYLWHIFPIFTATAIFSGQTQVLVATAGAAITVVACIILQRSNFPLKGWICGET